MESQTPAAPRTDHTTPTATTRTMPNAIESRNAVFITDQGSRCVSRRRARRGPRGRATVEPARVVDEVAEEPVAVDEGPAEVVAALCERLAPPAPHPGRDGGAALPAELTAAVPLPARGRFPVSPFDCTASDGPDRGRRGASGVLSARRLAIKTPRSPYPRHPRCLRWHGWERRLRHPRGH